MLNIAIIGFGVVGGGVAEVIEKNSIEIEKAVGDRVFVKYILDLRDFPDSPYSGRVVKEIAPILEDPDVSVVVETMGGSHPAFEYSIAAMEAGKSVVTSNKEVVSVYGKELLSCASSHGVSYLFEASVGGGIPLIRSLRTSLRGDTICRIDGIMNGTTNFILTKMRKEGRDYAEVLREAQARGYAERNPKADVEGIDTQRKIIILTALSSGKLLDSSSVHTEPMTGITIEDFDDAARLGCSIKLIGSYRKKEDGRVVAWVIPCLVPSDHPLFAVDDVYNAVLVESPVTGDVLYYGQGAGRYPTAGAVVSDIVSVGSGLSEREAPCVWEKAESSPFEEESFSYVIRMRANHPDDAVSALKERSGQAEIFFRSGETFSVRSGQMKEKEAQALFSSPLFSGLVSVLREL